NKTTMTMTRLYCIMRWNMMNEDTMENAIEFVAQKYKLWNPDEVCPNERFELTNDSFFICRTCGRIALSSDNLTTISYFYRSHIRKCSSFTASDDMYCLLGKYLNVEGNRQAVMST